MAIRLAIADPRELVRMGLAALLQGSDFEVVAATDSDAELCDMLGAQAIDVMVLAESLLARDRTGIMQRLQAAQPGLPVVLLCRGSGGAVSNGPDSADDDSSAAQVFESDSRGRLLLALQDAVRHISSGAPARELVAENRASRPAVSVDGQAAVPRSGLTINMLTQREREVLRQIVQGHTNKQIAELLGIGAETVKEHVRHLLRKLKLKDRTQAAVWAVRQGLQ